MVKTLRNPATTQEEFPGDETVARNTQAVPGDTLIEEQFHFKVAVKLVLASSIAAIASARVTNRQAEERGRIPICGIS